MVAPLFSVKKVPVICTSLHFAGGFLFSFVNGRTGINDRDYNGFDSKCGVFEFFYVEVGRYSAQSDEEANEKYYNSIFYARAGNIHNNKILFLH